MSMVTTKNIVDFGLIWMDTGLFCCQTNI